MFDKLIDFLVSFWGDLIFWKIVNQWEKGVHLRVGKFIRIVEPGLVFKIPHFDKVLTCGVITQTVNLPPQTLTTKDDREIVLKSMVRYHVNDVEKFYLGVMHANDVLIDTTQGIIRDIIELTEWKDLVNVNDKITKEVHEVVLNWGIVIEKITLTDLGIARTFRIIGDGDSTKNLIQNVI